MCAYDRGYRREQRRKQLDGASNVLLVDQSTGYVHTTSPTSRRRWTSNTTSAAWPWTTAATSPWCGSAMARPATPIRRTPISIPTASTDAGVYMRLYDRNNTPLTGETLVNTYTIGDKTTPSVAMDADGDFVVVWASQGPGPRRQLGHLRPAVQFGGAKGRRRVPRQRATRAIRSLPPWPWTTSATSSWSGPPRDNPSATSTTSTPRRSTPTAKSVGNEIQVNSQNIPGTSGTPSSNNLNPAVALSDNGTFVVTWDAVTNQQNGIILDTVVMARGFDANDNPRRHRRQHGRVAGEHRRRRLGGLVHVHDTTVPAQPGTRPVPTPGRRRNAQVSMDRAGDFIVTWEAYRTRTLHRQ